MGNCRSDRHKSNQRKVKKNIVVKSMLFSSLVLGGMLLSNGHEVHASQWQANSPEAIRATLQENQSSYTFEEGDTFYNIGIAVNVKWQTLMTEYCVFT